MAKRFKLRICKAIATTLQSCRSKDPSNLPQDPVPSFHPLSISIRRGLPSDKTPTASRPPQFKWQKEDKWHVVAEIHQQPGPPSSAERNRRLGKKKKKKKKNVPSRLRLSTSSVDSGWFSSEGGGGADEEETETLVSSSISLSPEFNPQSQQRSKRRVSKRRKRGVLRAEDVETPARLSMLKKLIPCRVDGKVKESFAIVKRSEDPYEDFKSSMMDMIVEKHMSEEKELEQLLQCFLSLNSRHYHGIIIQAFSEIWDLIFSPN